VSRPLLRAEVLDRYVEFVAARCRPNTVIATVSDLRAFFAVIDKAPSEVTTKDVFEFIAAQRRVAAVMVVWFACPMVRRGWRRARSVAGWR
jgi:hypothetical protein